MRSRYSFGVFSFFLWLGLVAPGYAAADPKVLHVLNRLGFGARPGDVERVQAMGVDRYVQQQLNPQSIQESTYLERKLATLETLDLTPAQLAQQIRPRVMQAMGAKTPEAKQQARKEARQEARVTLQQAVEAKLLRSLHSQRQLEEVMVDFWFNHFNVFSGKGLTFLWVGSYESQAIRPYSMGRFRDLLGATARHPAMLFYLDNWQNTAPNSPGAKGRFKGLNENYARELMELHTLGVNGGYTQQDVMSLAKILTGWGMGRASGSNGFKFDADRHDFSDKLFLGQTIKGSGVQEVEQALDMLAKHPATARHISYKLAQYFVTDVPPQSLVDRLTQRYLATDGNIRAMLETLFRSEEFWDSKVYNAKFKTPYQYVVSAMRAAGTEVEHPRPLYAVLQQLGMPPYGCQTPDGYKNTEAAWLNPDGLSRRLSFATALANGQLGAVAVLGGRDRLGDRPSSANQALATSKPVDAQQLMITLGDRLSDKTKQAIATSPSHLQAALILGSPDFMRR
jgi:uncharacterized protein (DUF1800 family)